MKLEEKLNKGWKKFLNEAYDPDDPKSKRSILIEYGQPTREAVKGLTRCPPPRFGRNPNADCADAFQRAKGALSNACKSNRPKVAHHFKRTDPDERVEHEKWYKRDQNMQLSTYFALLFGRLAEKGMLAVNTLDPDMKKEVGKMYGTTGLGVHDALEDWEPSPHLASFELPEGSSMYEEFKLSCALGGLGSGQSASTFFDRHLARVLDNVGILIVPPSEEGPPEAEPEAEPEAPAAEPDKPWWKGVAGAFGFEENRKLTKTHLKLLIKEELAKELNK